MTRFLIHYGIHFLVPVAVALLFYRKNWGIVLFMLWAGILIDLDHLWADPVFDPNRCSIGYHTFHQVWLIGVYGLMAVFKKTRLIGLALLLHMLADATDCALMAQS